jgi:hypothetical protein
MLNNTQRWAAVILLFVGTACMAAAAQIATIDSYKRFLRPTARQIGWEPGFRLRPLVNQCPELC